MAHSRRPGQRRDPVPPGFPEYVGMAAGGTPIPLEIASGLRPRNDIIDPPRNLLLW
jgi:hypothetical protein